MLSARTIPEQICSRNSPREHFRHLIAASRLHYGRLTVSEMRRTDQICSNLLPALTIRAWVRSKFAQIWSRIPRVRLPNSPALTIRAWVRLFFEPTHLVRCGHVARPRSPFRGKTCAAFWPMVAPAVDRSAKRSAAIASRACIT